MAKRILLVFLVLAALAGAALTCGKLLRREEPIPASEQPDEREAFQALQEQANAMTQAWTISSFRPGEAIREQVGAPETVTAAWQSRTGKTNITLQAVPVAVPETDQMNLIFVSPRLFSPEEVLRVLRVFSPDAAAASLAISPRQTC